MDREEIKEIIPHREVMLLIDRVELQDEAHAVGVCHVRGDEWFVRGHYPGDPIVPGVILCEMIAQTCCVMVMKKNGNGTPYFVGIRQARFLKKVRPGDRIVFDCEMLRKRPPLYLVRGSGSINGEVCVTGEFSFALVEGP